ncbi:uncharacterized protein MELLADRAFT_93853 [Melampsora larici-populina 98AG31]|uniref:Uncharacterized protein n=1 Tax=Melampsora larici-populina (strain 98AG31 / pathotype 3-4-7) TaxID=747676 RepID=F4S5H4_MELLP|nr:uncharacterized protein MELLADRAFT_93853 [Melampsora larici-populina 98AG31]EGG00026.1 hypothetical protein MELLADRAFT_93853 [Melampsora larici-populina 98AG31]
MNEIHYTMTTTSSNNAFKINSTTTSEDPLMMKAKFSHRLHVPILRAATRQPIHKHNFTNTPISAIILSLNSYGAFLPLISESVSTFRKIPYNSRGTSNNVFDPSNPSNNKQAMLDWLRINHPMTPIKSNANKAEVAKIVREQQPQFFPNPSSDAPAQFIAQDIKPQYPSLKNLPASSLMNSQLADQSGQMAKRAASQDLVPDNPQKRIGIDPDVKVSGKTRPVSKLTKKKTVGQQKSSSRLKPSKTMPGPPNSELPTSTKNSKPSMQSGTILPDWRHGASISSSKTSSLSDVSNQEERQELEALKKSIFSPPVNQVITVSQASKFKTSQTDSESAMANPFFETHTSKRVADSIGPKTPNKTNAKGDLKHTPCVPEDMDLIHFSDTEVFEVGNLVIGRDIPAIDIETNHISPKKKSGVDVFREEQQREEKVRTLEERIVKLETSLGAIDKSLNKQLFEDLQKPQVDASVITHHSSLLEQARETIDSLESKVATLEVRVTEFQHNLDSAHGKIKAHEQIIRTLLEGCESNMEEEYDSDSDDEELDHDSNKSSD